MQQKSNVIYSQVSETDCLMHNIINSSLTGWRISVITVRVHRIQSHYEVVYKEELVAKAYNFRE